MKTYVGIIRDHSASMRGLAKEAMNDYNLLLNEIKSSENYNHSLYLTVINCGEGTLNSNYKTIEYNEPIEKVKQLTSYTANGRSTPLYDSVGRCLEILEGLMLQEINNKDSAFLMMVITDGEENSSVSYNSSTLSRKIQQLQATDRFTFTFRVPKGHKNTIQKKLGIPDGNIIEWGFNQEELVHSTQQTVGGLQNYLVLRASGVTSTDKFYTDLSSVTVTEIKEIMKDNSSDYLLSKVRPENNEISIKDFCLNNFGQYKIGKAYYELNKTETVQQQKEIVIRDQLTGDIYSGKNARTLLKIPYHGSIKLVPGKHGHYDVFVQSTSVNRKLYSGNSVLYQL